MKVRVSVLMAVYKNDRPDWFKSAVDSMLNQTHKPDEVIVVVDGPIGKELENVIRRYGKRIRVVRIAKNKGLWNALNVGLGVAKNELVARMDSDDIAVNDRISKQVDMFLRDEDLDLAGGQIQEFEGNIENLTTRRQVPLFQKDIIKYAKYRSPFNHPTVMYKKTVINKYGGYHAFMRTEDYDLWVRLLMNGCKVANHADTLTFYRLSENNQKRKVSRTQQKESIALTKRFYRLGFLSKFEYAIVVGIKITFFLLPTSLKTYIYTKVLRK